MNRYQGEKSMNKSDFYYSAEEFIFCEKHFIKHFGPCDYIFHDSSDKIPHVDIYVILPTKQHPYYRLITCGMGSCSMSLPEDLFGKEFDRIELMFTLPSAWEFNEKNFYINKNYWWPVLLLKDLSEFPFIKNTWYGCGHKIVFTDIFKENPALNSVTLTAPVNYPLSSHYINFPNGKKVRILEVLPVF